jgi:hypothetical protein
MVRAASSLQTGALDIGDTECPSEGGLTYPAEQSAAPDCRKRPLLRRVRFRQQVSASVSAHQEPLYFESYENHPRNGLEETAITEDTGIERHLCAHS